MIGLSEYYREGGKSIYNYYFPFNQETPKMKLDTALAILMTPAMRPPIGFGAQKNDRRTDTEKRLHAEAREVVTQAAVEEVKANTPKVRTPKVRTDEQRIEFLASGYRCQQYVSDNWAVMNNCGDWQSDFCRTWRAAVDSAMDAKGA